MVVTIMIAANDKTARGLLRAHGLVNGMAGPFAGTGVLVRDWFAAFQYQQRPQMLRKNCSVLLSPPRQIVGACGHKQYSDSPHENLNPQQIQAQFDRGIGAK